MSTKFLLVVAFATMATAHAQSCSRDSLKAMVANYFKAVETHNSSALPTAANLRITENGREIKLGEGFQKTGGKTLMQRHLIDTERCGTLTEAVAEETIDGKTEQSVMAVRLKVDAGKVSEIETVVLRKSDTGLATFYNPKQLLDTIGQDWTTPLPAANRQTRAYMNDAANRYFSSFAADPQNDAPYATPCHRWEGGLQTTAKTGNCSPKGLVVNHIHRRFPVTDLELGITAGFINFGGSLPDVHMFKFNKDGKIELINAVFGGRQDGIYWPDETK